MSTRGNASKSSDIELGIGCPTPDWPAVIGDCITIRVAQHAKVPRAEGLEPVGRGLRDLPRCVDFVVQQHEHAKTTRVCRRGSADSVDEVHAGVGRQGTCRALRSNDHDRQVDVQREVEEVGRFFQRGRAMRHHDAGEVPVLLGQRFDLQDQGFPLRKKILGLGSPQSESGGCLLLHGPLESGR